MLKEMWSSLGGFRDKTKAHQHGERLRKWFIDMLFADLLCELVTHSEMQILTGALAIVSDKGGPQASNCW